MGYIIPPRKTPSRDEEYFEILCKAVFQAGFNWKVVQRKWPDFSRVFEEFDFRLLAQWDEAKVAFTLNQPTIIRNSRKIRAVVANAQTFVSIVLDHGSFGAYLGALRPLGYSGMSKALIKHFTWLGRTGTYFFLWSVGEEVPEWVER